jgi:8-oxo-dGTP pyrophosphatase MutT (NUDIX family)
LSDKELQGVLVSYLEIYPEERGDFKILQKQLATDEPLNDRRNFLGHITGSAIVLSPDKTKILLIYHHLFDRWQQPGGHWEGDEDHNPLETSRREAIEETGIRIEDYLPLDTTYPLVPLDIDSHPVPPQPAKDEPAHRHHDMRYVFVAADETIAVTEREKILDAGWFGFDAPETASVRRVIQKLREQNLVQA